MNNTNKHPELKMGKLIIDSETFINASVLKNIYGFNYINLLFLVNNNLYLQNFINEFEIFIKILITSIKHPITVEKFISKLNEQNYYGIYELYTDILNKYNNYMYKIFFPNDINNIIQLNILFQNITFSNIKERKDFCKNPDIYFTNYPRILDIFIMSSYTNYEIVSFYNLNRLINSENCKKLKINNAV